MDTENDVKTITLQCLHTLNDTMEKVDAKKKTDFWHTEAFRTYVLIRL